MQIDEIIGKYNFLKDYIRYSPFGNGHINDTYLIETPGEAFILQKVNKNVFDIPALVSNLDFFFSALWEYESFNGVKLTPAVYKSDEGSYHVIDDEGAAWRVMEFFPGCSSYAISPDTGISYKAARAMGSFQLFLNELPAAKFRDTIKGFHDTPGRYETFLQTLNKIDKSKKKEAAKEIEFVLKYGDIACDVRTLFNSGKLHERVTHNDTKLDNILFTADGQTLIIDLDTLMPGYIMYDYGDMVRTFTSPAKEDERDIGKVQFRIEHFKALTKGYVEALKGKVDKTETQSLLTGAKAIIYEQTIRFLNDYLLGNIYYKVKYPEHNLVRTRTQIKLLEGILSNEKMLSDYIEELADK